MMINRRLVGLVPESRRFIALVAVAVRALCASGAAWASHRASRAAKRRLRPLIFFSSMMFAPPLHSDLAYSS